MSLYDGERIYYMLLTTTRVFMEFLEITATSETGGVRSNNEDMILVGSKFIRNENYRVSISLDTLKRKRLIVALADGMGGHRAGEVASAEALIDLQHFIHDMPEHLSEGDFDELVVDWLASVNRKMNQKGQLYGSLAEMGTTLVALVIYEGRFYCMNCGDSRLYLFHDNLLAQLTVDHSLNTMLGESAHSNVITNCIGAGCKTSYIEICNITPRVSDGDTLMLCSDGLNDMVDDGEIAALLSGKGDACQLCQAAIKAGGYDNVSACVVRIR